MNTMKFAVIKTKGNTETLIHWFDHKDDASAFGLEYFRHRMRPGDGTLTIEGFRIDADGAIMSGQRHFFGGWHF